MYSRTGVDIGFSLRDLVRKVLLSRARLRARSCRRRGHLEHSASRDDFCTPFERRAAVLRNNARDGGRSTYYFCSSAYRCFCNAGVIILRSEISPPPRSPRQENLPAPNCVSRGSGLRLSRTVEILMRLPRARIK